MKLTNIQIEDTITSNIVNGILLILKNNPKAIVSTSAYGDPTLFVNREDYKNSLILTKEEENLLENWGWIRSYDDKNVIRSWEISN